SPRAAEGYRAKSSARPSNPAFRLGGQRWDRPGPAPVGPQLPRRLRRSDRHELRARRGRPLHRDPGHRRAGALQTGRDGPDAQARYQGRRRAGRGPEEGAEASLNRLLLATTNEGKLTELRALLAELPMELVTPADVGIRFDVSEDGASYLEN